MRAHRLVVLPGVVLLAASLAGCQLFDTRGSENGGGQSAHLDPYVGARSAAVRLGLQYFKGCPILATGEPTGVGTSPLPAPPTCVRHPAQELVPATTTPTPMPLVTDTDYFLGQIALMDEISNAHTDPTRPSDAVTWITTQSLFKDLDWTGLSTVSDRTEPNEGGTPNVYDRHVRFGNSAWEQTWNDTFRVELLDSEGQVRDSQEYSRLDFLAENATSGHTKIGWSFANLGAPLFPGDVALHTPPPAPPSAPPIGPVSSQTYVRIERTISTHPSKTLSVPFGLTGDGALKVTWSHLPQSPFYFPVRFTARESLATSCFTPEGAPVACNFGLVPDAVFSRPGNGTHYVPGESFDITIAAKDGAGNLLHPQDRLPSWNDYFRGQANGLLYLNLFVLSAYGELDTVPGMAIAGPLHLMRFYNELGQSPWLHTADFMTTPFPDGGNSMVMFPTAAAAVGVLPGGRDTPVPTQYRFTVPQGAPPGTYIFELKLHRQFAGERATKAKVFYFQVGQETATRFPGRVGNCQLCHRGAIALDNVRHGLPVDFVEGCKTCHNRDEPVGLKSVELVHAVHMNSPKYPAAKNDCAVCHLTKESVTRPSLAACGSCHPSVHGDDFFQMAMQQPSVAVTEPNKFSNCAQACHGVTLPNSHLVPAR